MTFWIRRVEEMEDLRMHDEQAKRDRGATRNAIILGDLARWHSASDLNKRTRGSAPEIVTVHKVRSARP
jgi:hypothetical protein